MKTIRLLHEKNGFAVEAEARLIGDDVAIALWGGTRPHIGAVALAIPRPSLRDPSRLSATSSVLTSPGHKEDDVVKWFSERVSAALGCTVVVSAGMHWDHLSGADLGVVGRLCEELAERMIDRLKKEKA